MLNDVLVPLPRGSTYKLGFGQSIHQNVFMWGDVSPKNIPITEHILKAWINFLHPSLWWIKRLVSLWKWKWWMAATWGTVDQFKDINVSQRDRIWQVIPWVYAAITFVEPERGAVGRRHTVKQESPTSGPGTGAGSYTSWTGTQWKQKLNGNLFKMLQFVEKQILFFHFLKLREHFKRTWFQL